MNYNYYEKKSRSYRKFQSLNNVVDTKLSGKLEEVSKLLDRIILNSEQCLLIIKSMLNPIWRNAWQHF